MLKMYLDIIDGLDILGTNKLIVFAWLWSGMANFVLNNWIPRSLKLQ